MTRPRFHPLFSEPDGLEGREEDRALHLCRGCCPGGGKAGRQGAEAHSLPPPLSPPQETPQEDQRLHCLDRGSRRPGQKSK